MDSKHAESDCFPLCFPSFELLKQRLRVSNRTQKLEDMDNFMAFLEMDNEKEEKSCNQSQHVKKTRVWDEELNHEEKEESSQWKVSSCFSNSEFLCQESLPLRNFYVKKAFH